MSGKRVTMRDIAEMAGVSQSAVSMILNQRYDAFPEETVQRVLEAAKSANYQMRKRAGRTARSRHILAITVQVTNPYYAEMLQSLDRAAIAQGIRITAVSTYHHPELEADALDMAIRQHYLGVIFLYPADGTEAYERANAQIPIVTICDKSSRVHGDIVEMNHFEAGAIAADHLISMGHRRIAVLSHASDRNTTAGATRLAGILAEIRKHGDQQPPLILTHADSWSNMLNERSYHYQTGYDLAQDPQIAEKGITGLICVNDLMAYGAIDALARQGCRVPEDLSVIGSDDILFSQMERVSLTTIEYHPDVVARAALTTLLNRTDLSTEEQIWAGIARFQVQCQPTLVIRGSTGPV